MNMNASGAGAGAAGAAVPPPTMNRPAYPVAAAPVSAAMRAYPQQQQQQPVGSDADTKQVTTEQIQVRASFQTTLALRFTHALACSPDTTHSYTSTLVGDAR